MLGSFGKGTVSSSMDHLLKCARTGAPTSCINISTDFSLKRQDLLPQKSGFVAAEIWISRLRNQILWSFAFRRRQLFSFQCCAAVSLSLFKTVSQSRLEMKIEDEISGCQAVSIKPHSGLTNKVEAGEKHPNAPPSRNFNVFPQKTLNVIDLCVLFSQQG